MAHYVHSVPGRLRVQCRTLKGQHHLAESARIHLHRVGGVLSAELRPVTGSIVVSYDGTRTSSQAILEALRAGGYIRHVPPESPRERSASRFSGAGSKIRGKVVDKLVETVIERSALALIGALI
jgi:copper chaperone CopZ